MRRRNSSLFPRSEERCSKGSRQNAPSASQDLHGEQRTTAKTQKQLRNSCPNSFTVCPCLQNILKTGSDDFDAVVPDSPHSKKGQILSGPQAFLGGVACTHCVCLGFVHFFLPQSNNLQRGTGQLTTLSWPGCEWLLLFKGAYPTCL